ncbi:MAG: hypothetical protein ABR575_10930 [Actinomycetota bacterium]
MAVRTGVVGRGGWDERQAMRWGGAAAMIGAVLSLIGNLLHPRSDDVENIRGELRLVADSDIWLVDHLVLAFSLAFLSVGLLSVASYLDVGAGTTWGRIARASVVGGLTVAFVTVAVDGMAMKAVADDWAAAGGGRGGGGGAEAVAQVSLALFTGLIGSFLGLTPLLVGLAQLWSGRFPAWLAYLAIGGGALNMVVGTLQYLNGPSNLLTNVIFTIGALIITAWAFLSGWHLWQRSSGPAAGTATPRVTA